MGEDEVLRKTAFLSQELQLLEKSPSASLSRHLLCHLTESS
jgi:hypothetical protein